MKLLHLRHWLAGSVLLLTVPACGGDDLVFPTDGTDGSPSNSNAALEMFGGDAQTGTPGSPLPQPVVVKLVDDSGNGISGQRVSWTVQSGGGTVVPTAPTTNEQGLASASWILGSEGPNSLTAEVPGAGLVTFTATADNGNPGGGGDGGGSGGGGSGGGGGGGVTVPSAGTSTVSADPSSIMVGSGVSTIRVTVRDAAGVPVPGAVVTLSATGSGNRVTQPETPTGDDGVAIGTLESSVAGTKDVVATVNGTLQINQTAQVTVTTAPASRVRIVEGNGERAQVGNEVPVRPAVRVLDAAGNPVAGYEVTFVVTRGGGTVTGAVQTTNAEGIARVESWVLGNEGRNTLEARAGSLQGSPAVFDATAVAPPPPPPPPPPPGRTTVDHLVFRVQPHDVRVNETFRVEVALVDAQGEVVPLSGIFIYLGLFADGRNTPTNTHLRGEHFENTEDGIAVLDVRVDEQGRFRLRALTDDLPELGPHGPEPYLFSRTFEVN